MSEAIKTCNYYKKVYFTRKDNIDTYFKDPNTPVVQWAFDPELIFARLDNFIGRLATFEVMAILGVFGYVV